jgi:hypothetical protein
LLQLAVVKEVHAASSMRKGPPDRGRQFENCQGKVATVVPGMSHTAIQHSTRGRRGKFVS